MEREVLQKLGIDKDMLGKVYESQEVTGTVSKGQRSLQGWLRAPLLLAAAAIRLLVLSVTE